MLSGIVNVNKPKGLTSHQVVAKLRKILGIRQIGHTGTLDPMAVGVLPICVGNATRIIEYLDTSKAYRAEFLLGVETDTYDTEGNILKETPVAPDKELIKAVLNEFIGEITQIPPMHSAVHYKGKRLYEYARKNIEIPDIPERKVKINSIRLVNIENSTIIADIDCSGGTYIRSIAHDLGEKLGCGACLSGLTRTKSGKFTLETSVTLEQIENNSPEFFLIPPQDALDLEIVEINNEQKDKIIRGQYFFDGHRDETLLQLIFEERLAAIARAENGKIRPIKVFV